MSWVSNGITGRGVAPPCAGSRKGLALVLGTARCVWEDLQKLSHFTRSQAEIIGINGMILFWPGRIHHGISMHPGELDLWRRLRHRYEGRDQAEFLTHTCKNENSLQPGASGKISLAGFDWCWDIVGAIGGTSGLFAVMVGLALGYEKIILAGVPMDGSGHLYDPPGTESTQFTQDWLETEWKKISAVYFNDRVRSLSGRTRDWLGAPTEDWLGE
jgi:hypothetical protein